MVSVELLLSSIELTTAIIISAIRIVLEVCVTVYDVIVVCDFFFRRELNRIESVPD